IWDCSNGALVAQSRQGPEFAMDVSFSPDESRLAVASRQQIKLVDAETAEEVMVLRGRAQLTPNNNGFNPRVRFSPDGRILVAICSDTSDPVAIWSVGPRSPGGSLDELRRIERRAVAQHLQLAYEGLYRMWIPSPASVPLERLEQAVRYHLDQLAKTG